jgi:hypothetical protein
MSNSEECPVCYEVLNDENYMVICENEHQICSECYKTIMDGERSKNCPFDRVKMIDWRPQKAPLELHPLYEEVGAIDAPQENPPMEEIRNNMRRNVEEKLKRLRELYKEQRLNSGFSIQTVARRQEAQRLWIEGQHYDNQYIQAIHDSWNVLGYFSEGVQCGHCKLHKHNRVSCPWKKFIISVDRENVFHTDAHIAGY